jgi:hypothetical protein
MKHRYLDAVDLRIIDELAEEARRSGDTEDLFQCRRRQIFDLYLSGVQWREEIFKRLANAADMEHPKAS